MNKIAKIMIIVSVYVFVLSGCVTTKQSVDISNPRDELRQSLERELDSSIKYSPRWYEANKQLGLQVRIDKQYYRNQIAVEIHELENKTFKDYMMILKYTTNPDLKIKTIQNMIDIAIYSQSIAQWEIIRDQTLNNSIEHKVAIKQIAVLKQK